MRLVYILATLLLVTTGTTTHAQKMSFRSRQGDRAMNLFDYKLAIANYTIGVRHHTKDSLYAMRKIADCYRLMNDPAKAKEWYGKLAAKPTVEPLVKFYYAEALRETQDYVNAKKYYEAYKATGASDRNVNDILAGLDNVQDLAKDKGIYKIELLNINSPFSDFGPAFYGKDSIFFTSNRKNAYTWRADRWSSNDYYQIFKAPTNGGGASKILKKRPNGKFHDGPVAYYAPSSLMVFTRSNYIKCAKTASDKRTVNLKLFSMVYPYTKKPKLFSLPFNDNNFSNAHPCFSKDGKTLYFASDRPGGFGGTDIYKSERIGDSWGTPVNLGADINGKYDEKFPFIGDDGTLYFASNALGGLGGLDIYESKKEDGKWTKPTNLGAPINSNADDFGLILRDDIGKGYFTSNRKGGYGDDDIYGFTKKTIVERPITIRVIDADSKDPIEGASVDIPCANGKIKNFLCNGLGEVKTNLNPKATCDATAVKDGYEANGSKVEFSTSDNVYVIPLKKKVEGVKLWVAVKERGTEIPVRDFNIAIKDETKSTGVSTVITGVDGTFETNIQPTNAYAISSPDAASIKDEILVTEQPDANGYIKRTYYIDPIKRKVSVPITSECFQPNSIIVATSKATGEVVRARVDEKGLVRLALHPNTKYAIASEDKVDEFETTNLKPGDVINMKCKFVVGQTWILRNIYYDLDKSFIRPDAAKELNNLVGVMKGNPTLEIELSSHTDCRQTAAYNNILSAKRAKAAVQYIVSKGITSRRMIAAGYGESKLVNGCSCEPTNESPCTNEEHQMNRRTEVKVLKY